MNRRQRIATITVVLCSNFMTYQMCATNADDARGLTVDLSVAVLNHHFGVLGKSGKKLDEIYYINSFDVARIMDGIRKTGGAVVALKPGDGYRKDNGIFIDNETNRRCSILTLHLIEMTASEAKISFKWYSSTTSGEGSVYSLKLENGVWRVIQKKVGMQI